MSSTQLWGILMVVMAGLLTGSNNWPIKLMRTYAYEHIALVSITLGWMVTWLIVLTFCPHAIEAYRSVDPMILIRSNLFSLVWGVAVILWLQCVLRIGFSLTGALMTGIAVPVGVTVPMIFKGTGLFQDAPDLFSPAGYAVLTGVVVMLFGVLLTAIAGHLRHEEIPSLHRGGFKLGLLMVVLAGILSMGANFSFVYSQGPIVEAMKARGAGDIAAKFSVWAVSLAAGNVLNILYPLYLIAIRKSWHHLWSARELLCCLFMAAIGWIPVVLMGQGMIALGVLGASIGIGIEQAMHMIGGQSVGFISGEWRGAPRRAIVIMIAAIVLLILAAFIMAYGNTLATAKP